MAQHFALPVDPPRVVVMLADSETDRTVIWLTAAEDDGADLVFDLSGVAFMDTTTLHQIVNARSLLARYGRATVIREPTPFVHRLLAMCRLRDLVEAGPSALPDWPASRAEFS